MSKMAKQTVQPGKTVVYIIKAFDTYQWKFYIPSPGVFLIKSHAEKFCTENSKNGVVMTWERTIIGKMKR